MGRTKHMRIMPGGALEQDQEFSGPSSVFVGRKLDEYRGAFVLEYPMHKGHVVSGGWDAMERVWEVRFYFYYQVYFFCDARSIHHSTILQPNLACILQE